MARDKQPVEKSLKQIFEIFEKMGGDKDAADPLAFLAELLVRSPNPASRLIEFYKSVGPTPRFTGPDIPFSQPWSLYSSMGFGFPIGLKANINHANNYTLVMFKDGDGNAINPTLGGMAPPAHTNITITPAGNFYIIVGTSFPGPGDYLLRVTANGSFTGGDLGYGRTSIEITLT